MAVVKKWKFWHWPNKTIGKRESGEMREEHNALGNSEHALAGAVAELLATFHNSDVQQFMKERGDVAQYHKAIREAAKALRESVEGWS